MKRLLRPLVLIGVLTLIVGSLVPPWDVCWHVDGSTCLNPGPGACCDEEGPTPSEPEPCSDCADLAILQALKTDDQPRFASLTAAPSLLQPPSLTLEFCSCARPVSRADHGPPRASPVSLLSPPLLC